MAESTLHTTKDMSGWYESRRLEENFPQLVPFLFPGADVLDVGCGPGTITLGVSNAVAPGSVIGVDREEELLQRAETNATASGTSNVKFVQDDAYNLHLAENSFDITYSRDVMHFLSDPIRALREQKRVTKPNGRIIAFANDWATFTSYPELPFTKKVIRCWKAWTDPGDHAVFVDQFVGSKLFSYFSAAGIRETEVHGVAQRSNCVASGSEAFTSRYPRFKMHFQASGAGKANYDMLLSQGFLSQADLDRALHEIEDWHSNPGAFMSVNHFLAIGTA